MSRMRSRWVASWRHDGRSAGSSTCRARNHGARGVGIAKQRSGSSDSLNGPKGHSAVHAYWLVRLHPIRRFGCALRLQAHGQCHSAGAVGHGPGLPPAPLTQHDSMSARQSGSHHSGMARRSRPRPRAAEQGNGRRGSATATVRRVTFAGTLPGTRRGADRGSVTQSGLLPASLHAESAHLRSAVRAACRQRAPPASASAAVIQGSRQRW